MISVVSPAFDLFFLQTIISAIDTATKATETTIRAISNPEFDVLLPVDDGFD